jgi:hypothetical protein
MWTKILKFLNDNHWYIIAGAIIFGMMFWTYGCESKVKSLIDPNTMVNRGELQVEIEYVAGIAKTRVEDLDKQDEIKLALFNALTMVSQGGQINSMGVLNLAATIVAIGWGLKKNQQVNALTKTT